MPHHVQLYLSDQVPPRVTCFAKGKSGRLSTLLPPFASDRQTMREKLLEIGKKGGLMDANDPLTPNPNNRDNSTMTASFTFLGQFIDHDIINDATSSLERQNAPEAVENFRTPFLSRAWWHRIPRHSSAHQNRRWNGARLALDQAKFAGAKVTRRALVGGCP